jgi:hypothetical protein
MLNDNSEFAIIPEPSSAMLLGEMAGLAVRRRRQALGLRLPQRSV